ncbi:glycoside hydrolase family 114 protein [Cercospora zeae-maydis SCOH1-5]|uniref:alpha-galactosidase n=1 Tax=Cercospora zeae-maydis SCOH1-5 TaxID=717836 RepID=A0A6A6F7M0_9PEZI|nr:glycoside hydrolase family 114 protein [Cercospora zeae-maydis SCOH1-5]
MTAQSTLKTPAPSPAASIAQEHESSPIWKPTVGQSWNIQLASVPPSSAANDNAYSIWDFDMAAASSSLIESFHAEGRRVICYFSAGSVEKYRSDSGEFPKEAVGKVMDGWPDENWVDIRNSKVRDIITRRIGEARSKGCDGVDPDNIDGYQNDSGFDLTEDDAVNFVRFLSQTAHKAGLAYGLKNGDNALVVRVVEYSQWVINEECVHYNECDIYKPFVEANKPVFHIEYPNDAQKLPIDAFRKQCCTDPDARGFSTLVKQRELTGWTTTC